RMQRCGNYFGGVFLAQGKRSPGCCPGYSLPKKSVRVLDGLLYLHRPFTLSLPMNPYFSRVLARSISSLLTLVAATTASRAAVKIWDGGPTGTGTDLATAANWRDAPLPAVN